MTDAEKRDIAGLIRAWNTIRSEWGAGAIVDRISSPQLLSRAMEARDKVYRWMMARDLRYVRLDGNIYEADEDKRAVFVIKPATIIDVTPPAAELPRFLEGEEIDITGGVDSVEYIRRGRDAD